MKHWLTRLIFGGIVLTVLLLTGIQYYWFKSQFALQSQQFNTRATSALKKTMETLSASQRCFILHSKVYIKSGEGFLILKPQWDSTGKFVHGTHDSVPMYYVGGGRDSTVPDGVFNNLMFSTPAVADLNLKFEFQTGDSTGFSRTAAQITQTNDPLRIKEIVTASVPFSHEFDTLLLRETLQKYLALENLPADFVVAITDAGTHRLLYCNSMKDTAHARQSPVKLLLNETDVFSRAYEVMLFIKTKDDFIFKNLQGMLMLSAVVLLILVFGIWYFVRVIRHHNRLMAVKNDLISNLSHELNTPVTNISLALETLKDERSTSDKDKVLSIITNANTLLRNNVEKILQISYLEKATIIPEFKSLDVVAVAETVVSDFDLVIKQKQALVSLVAGTRPMMMEADETHLVNIVYNLLDNALKYSGKNPVITIELRDTRDTVTMRFSDNGIGMDQEQLSRIFDKFYRIPKGDIHDIKGFGLGLAYVKLMVEAHGGSIHVESRRHTGSRFEMIFPKSHLQS